MDSSHLDSHLKTHGEVAPSAFHTLRERISARLSFENRILLLTLAVAVPGFLATLVLLWTGRYGTRIILVVSILLCAIVWKLSQELRALLLAYAKDDPYLASRIGRLGIQR